MTDFRDVRFKGKATFESCCFSGNADLRQLAVDGGPVSFQRCAFTDVVSFGGPVWT
jgi:hypothetical protein